jgi:hypothetical protein
MFWRDEAQMPVYTHTLIPDKVDFAPEPEQVRAFLDGLMKLGAAPSKATIMVAKLSGESRSFVNPFTGKSESFASRKGTKVKDSSGIPKALVGLSDFDVTITGKSPTKVAPFEFDFKGTYDFIVRCCLRPEVVSTSDWHDEVPIKQKVAFFGKPCSEKDRKGIFIHPDTLKIIEVPKAGCARFWIEFEFGKMLFPKINKSLDLIEPAIVEVAKQQFGVNFIQGCRWCA